MYLAEEWVDNLLVHEVERALKHAAERWAHVAYDQYTSFQPLVDLLPHSITRQAATLLETMPQKRLLIGADYAQAAWQLVCAGIEALRPAAVPDDPIRVALDHAGGGHPWPAGRCIPQRWARYSILYLKYVTKTHTNKELALLCAVPVRQVITLRNHGLGEVACRLIAWEQQLMNHDAAPRLHLDAPQRHIGRGDVQQRDSILATQRV